jgi:hypothetical protein
LLLTVQSGQTALADRHANAAVLPILLTACAPEGATS